MVAESMPCNSNFDQNFELKNYFELILWIDFVWTML